MPLDLALDEDSAQIPLTQQPTRPQLFETGVSPGWETRSSGCDGNNCLVYIRKLPCGGRIEAYSLLEAQDIHKGNFGMEGWDVDEHVLRQAYPPGRCLDSAALQECLLVLRSSGSWTYGRLYSVATSGPLFFEDGRGEV
jgi:hypothetical protein